MTDLPKLTHYDIGPGATAFCTTRHGGCSEGAYASMNINPYCGDSPEAVQNNRQLLAQEIGLPDSRILLPHQTHQTEMRLIGEEFFQLPSSVQAMVLEGVDGIMTALPGVCVGVSTADCVPLLLHDERHHAVAAVHAGWRGTVAHIAQKALLAMNAFFGTKPKHVRVVIGPCISMDAFEVGDEVYEQFVAASMPMDCIAVRRKKWHIDLPLCNRLLLEEMGVASAKITSASVCTYNNADDYFSARRLGTQSGRIYSGIFL